MKFTSVKVYYSYPDNTVITWDVENVRGEPKFTVERSLSPQDGFEIVKDNISENYCIDDLKVRNRNVLFYYRIKGIDDSGDSISDPVELPFPPVPILN
jgi:hypothetical protein